MHRRRHNGFCRGQLIFPQLLMSEHMFGHEEGLPVDTSPVEREQIRLAALHRHYPDGSRIFDSYRCRSDGHWDSLESCKRGAQSKRAAPDIYEPVEDWRDEPWYPEQFAAVVCERLTDREAQVVRMLFGLGDSPMYRQDEIAVRLGISQPAVAQFKASALAKLRDVEAVVKI